MTGQDSLLVYTYENVLYHYIISTAEQTVTLIQVGQLALHGIVRAPARVRAVTWILPEHQMRDGDPSQDVAHASVLFLVDAKLVLLQSSNTEASRKYDMRIIAHNVEYYSLMRDQGTLVDSASPSPPESPASDNALISGMYADRGLRDSLWYFDGTSVHCWMDVENLLMSASSGDDREIIQPVSIDTDFYPTSILIDRGVVLGLDAEMIQRRDLHFAFFRHTIRTQLFLPHVLRQLLSEDDSAAASVVALRYQELPYFSHALELLLHMVLDDEVDSDRDTASSSMPSTISFLEPFPDYLDIVVQCTRKTEVRSWRTLFRYLPPPQQLFEESMEKGLLKTAGGYLLVLHTFQELEASSEHCIRLLQKAKEANDWDLCKELARFLMALDASGDTLLKALSRTNLGSRDEANNGSLDENVQVKTPRPTKDSKQHRPNGEMSDSTDQMGGGDKSKAGQVDQPQNGTLISRDYSSPQG
ncbi:MAG: hypothetical protein Q9222_006989 [Ikaeria aurantiellina]